MGLLLTTKQVVAILAHYDVTVHGLTKWVQLSYIKPSLKLGEGASTRLYFSVDDVLGIAFFKMLLDLGRSREEAATRVDPSGAESVFAMKKAGRIYFNLTRSMPFPKGSAISMIGGGVLGFSAKPPGGQFSPMVCSINVLALEKEIQIIMEWLDIEGVEYGQQKES